MGVVSFKLEADEAKAVQGFLKLVDAQKKVERGAKNVGRAANKSEKAFRSMGKSAGRDLKNMVVGLGSVASAIAVGRAVWGKFTKDIADSVKALKEFQDEFINIQFLLEHYKDPKFRPHMKALATAAGIPPREMSKGVYALESMTSYATPARRAGMLTELIKVRKTTNVPLAELVPTFAKMGKIYPGLTGRGMANITQFMLEKAGIASPGELAAIAPRIFVAGKLGRLDPRTAAAMGAFMTLSTGSAARAATGMEMAMRKLLLEDPDEQEAIRNLAFGQKNPLAGRKAILKRAGIVGADTGYQRVLKLSKLTLSAQDMKDLLGERGMKYGQILFGDPEGLKKMVAQFHAATGPEKDIAGRKLGRALQIDPEFRALFAGDKLAAGLEQAKMRRARINQIRDNIGTAWEIRYQQGKESLWRTWTFQAANKIGQFFDPDSIGDAYVPDTTPAQLGITPPAGNFGDAINKAAQNLLNATENAKDANSPNPNAHVESSGGGI